MSGQRHWTDEQWQALSERRAELVVSAAAGSGKTSVLIERVLRAALGYDEQERLRPELRTGLDSLLVLTFTRAAAAELRSRLAERLRTELARPDSPPALRAALRDQLAALPRAQISTIDSFCAEVVRRFGHTCGISFGRILEQDEAELLMHELATQYLDARLGQASPLLTELALAWGGQDGVGPEDLSRVRSSGGLKRLVLRLHGFRQSLIDPDAWYSEHCAWPPLIEQHCDWEHPLLAPLREELARRARQLAQLDTQTATDLAQAHPGAEYLAIIARRRELLLRLAAAASREECLASLDAFSSKQVDLSFHPSLLTAQRREIPKDSPWYETIEQRNEPLSKTVKQWRERFSEPWPAVARRENQSQLLLAELWRLTTEFGQRYAELLRERGVVDFAALARGALRVLAAAEAGGPLRDSAGRLLPSEAALELRRRFAMVLIDEHQDTSELQGALLELVTRDAPGGPAGGGRPLFAVGDVKQSIYTFRLARPQLFAAHRRRLAAIEQQDPSIGRVIALNRNFRSRRPIVDAVNFVFDGLLSEELGGEDYAANRLRYGADYEQLLAKVGSSIVAAPDLPARLSLVLSDAVQPDNGANEDSGEQSGEEAAADAEDAAVALGRMASGYRVVAQRISEVITSGQLIYDKQAPEGPQRLRPVQWRDVVVLLRTASGRVETLLRELEAAGIDAYAEGQSGFYERPEVADVLSLLRVIDNPRQDIALASVLRGPAVRLEPAELLAVALSARRSNAVTFWERLRLCLDSESPLLKSAELRERLDAFLMRLEQWRDAARREPLPQLLWRLYSELCLLPAAAAQHGGKQGGRLGRRRVANLLRVHEMARQFAAFERQGLARFLRFIELNRRAAGDYGEAPVLSAAEDVVRVMTVHQAKGLEFPVVIVPDLDKQFNFEELKGDVLWNHETGLGGRYIDWGSCQPAADAAATATQDAPDAAQQPPQRFDTLARDAVKAAARQERAAEELRILYVALTRARERLELVGTVEAKWLQKPPQLAEAADARCWLDWLAPRFADAARASAEQQAALSCGEKGCWTVETCTPRQDAQQPRTAKMDPAESVAGPSSAESGAMDEGQLAQLRRRLDPQYPYPVSQQLPQKVTVTRLARTAAAISDADAAREYGGDAGDSPAHGKLAAAPAVVPQFLSGRREPSGAEVGAATHRLLAELDETQLMTAEQIAKLRDELAQRGVLDTSAARRIDCDAIAVMTHTLSERFGLASCRSWRELPLALLMPAREASLLAGLGLSIEPAQCAPEETVYVQGVVDLLVVWDETASQSGPAPARPRALIVDYKTDRQATASELAARYRLQLEWYCRAVALMLPGCDVQWALYGLAGAGLIGPHDYVAPV